MGKDRHVGLGDCHGINFISPLLRGKSAATATIVLEALLATAPSSIDSDLALVQAILRRDRKASAEFVQLCSDSVFRYVRFRLHPHVEAVDDVVQEVFLAAWKSLSNYRGGSPLQGWVLGIARHRVEDHYRQLLRNAQFVDDPEERVSDEPPLDDLLDRKSSHQRTAVILAALPEQYRTVLLWRYWDQRSADEIATEIDRTPKAVERLLSRARQQFREQWHQKEALR